MKKSLSLISSVEKHIEEAKKNLEALEGQNSPQSLLDRVTVLRDNYDFVTRKLKEKKGFHLRALIELAGLAQIDTVQTQFGLFKIENGKIYKGEIIALPMCSAPYPVFDNIPVQIEHLIFRKNTETFYSLCNALYCAVSVELEKIVTQPLTEIERVGELTKAILKIMESIAVNEKRFVLQ